MAFSKEEVMSVRKEVDKAMEQKVEEIVDRLSGWVKEACGIENVLDRLDDLDRRVSHLEENVSVVEEIRGGVTV